MKTLKMAVWQTRVVGCVLHVVAGLVIMFRYRCTTPFL